MIDAVLDGFLAENDVRAGRVLVAVSGGRDSMVLLDALVRVAPSHALEVQVGHVDHGLRDDSAADARFVEDAAKGLGRPFALRRVDPEARRTGRSSRERETLEEAARHARREALEALADEAGARWIMTAHHGGDQAETVLLRLLRGTGPEGLAAMRPVDETGRWLRPLLGTMPEEIAAAASACGVAWREDASNQDRRFTRNRLRHDWLPGLAEAFNPDLLRKLVLLAEAQRKDFEWIEDLVAEAAGEWIVVEPRGVRIAIEGWAGLPDPLALRLVRRALHEIGLARDVSRTHLERTLAFLRRGRAAGRDLRLELPRGIVLRREDEAFRLVRGNGCAQKGEA